MINGTPDSLSVSAYKGAVLLAGLGPEAAARVLSHLPEEQVEAIVQEFARLKRVPTEEVDLMAKDFGRRFEESAEGIAAGPAFARQTLEKALGPEKAGRILGKLELETEAPSLAAIVEKTSPEALAMLVASEHPQMIALLIDQLPDEKAAALLAALPVELQGQVAVRLARTETPSPIAIHHLERILMDKLTGSGGGASETASAGPKRVAEILGCMRKSVETVVLTSLQEQSPEIAEQVNHFRFGIEHFLELEDKAIQRILREVEQETLVLAMKGLDSAAQQVIYKNMSERAGERLMEDLEALGPARLKDVETAQQSIVSAAKSLEDAGEISLRRVVVSEEGGAQSDEEVFV